MWSVSSPSPSSFTFSLLLYAGGWRWRQHFRCSYNRKDKTNNYLPLINVGFLIPASLLSSTNNLAVISSHLRCKSLPLCCPRPPGVALTLFGTFCFSPWLTPPLGISRIVNLFVCELLEVGCCVEHLPFISSRGLLKLLHSSGAISMFSVRDGLCFTGFVSLCFISFWGAPSTNNTNSRPSSRRFHHSM